MANNRSGRNHNNHNHNNQTTVCICGKQVHIDDQFCPFCAFELRPHCLHCGKRAAAQHIFCVGCGRRVRSEKDLLIRQKTSLIKNLSQFEDEAEKLQSSLDLTKGEILAQKANAPRSVGKAFWQGFSSNSIVANVPRIKALEQLTVLQEARLNFLNNKTGEIRAELINIETRILVIEEIENA